MAVVYQTSTSTTTVQSGVVNGSHAVAVPSGLAAGDLWLIINVFDANAGGVINVPSGWTAVSTTLAGTPDGWPICRAFGKIAGASESAVTVSYTGTAWDMWSASIRLSGADPTTPIGNSGFLQSSGTANPTLVNAPDVTVQADGSLVVLWGAQEGDSGTGATGAITAPAGTTDIVGRTGANVFPIGKVSYEARNAGVYAPGDWSFPRANTPDALDGVVQTIEIRPAPAAAAELPPVIMPPMRPPR